MDVVDPKIADIFLVKFAFSGDPHNVKIRPALVIGIEEQTCRCLMFKITTTKRPREFCVPISEWKTAGLKAPSFVEINELREFFFHQLGVKLGSLHHSDLMSIYIQWDRLYEADIEL